MYSPSNKNSFGFHIIFASLQSIDKPFLGYFFSQKYQWAPFERRKNSIIFVGGGASGRTLFIEMAMTDGTRKWTGKNYQKFTAKLPRIIPLNGD